MPALGGCLERESIRQRLNVAPPLLEGYLDLEAQLQPNGFDLTVAEIAAFAGPGVLTASDAGRRLAVTTPLDFGPGDAIRLEPGPYLVTLNETVNLPLDVMALGKPRSSLLRSGVAMHNAVWDAGYRGRSQALLVVYHPGGFTLSRNARILQLVFFLLSRPVDHGYRGRYQDEGLR